MTLGPIQVALQVADALEACGVLYLVGGSVASSIGGEPRTTLDVDMVVAMADGDVGRFLAALGSEFYADDAAIRRAILQRASVNLIHQPSAIKVDLFIAGGSPLDAQQIGRRRRVQVSESPNPEAWSGFGLQQRTTLHTQHARMRKVHDTGSPGSDTASTPQPAARAKLSQKIQTMTPTSLILVEGNRLLREGLAAMVHHQEDMQILAALGDRDNVLQKIQQLTPRVVLLDLGLRSHDNLRLVETITKEHPDVRVIVMDLLPAQADIIEFVRAGVSGFLLMDATFDEFLKTIRLVAGGTNVLPPPLTDSLFSEIVNHEGRREKALLSSVMSLTKREREVIRLIADGLSNKEIGLRLNVATFTVKSHVHNVLEKLALRTRVQIATYYAREGATAIDTAADAFRTS